MTTQPLSKSDWDGHPVWWVRSATDPENQAMVTGIWENGIAAASHSLTKSFSQLTAGNYERSHDRITWTVCSKPAHKCVRHPERDYWNCHHHGWIGSPCVGCDAEIKKPHKFINNDGSRVKPAPPLPAPLQPREGAWYEREDGKVVRVSKAQKETGYPYAAGAYVYDKHGRIVAPWREGLKLNLIREVPPPQPDTVPVDALIEALSFRDGGGDSVLHGLANVSESGIERTRAALAALHPRLKEEVEK